MTDLCRKYYVDSINGSDTNDGLSENSAFASLFAVNRLALKPGDHILLACGSVFEKQRNKADADCNWKLWMW